MHGIYLIAIMVITGGIIAFIGDKLGTKIGKKRLSIFGLRPRHTSMIFTVLTGGLITALTMGTLAVASQDVRTALFGMEELNAAMESTRNKLVEVSDELFLTQTEFSRAGEDLERSRLEIENLKSEQSELEEESQKLREETNQLAQEKSQLTAQNEDLANSNFALEQSNRDLESNNKQLAEFNVTLTSENERLGQENSNLEQRNQTLRNGLIAMREGDIIFRAGEILASGVIDANQTSEKIAAQIQQLADEASRNISASFGESIDSSVWIYQPELQGAIETISNSQQDVVLRITAAGNLVRGEPIRTSLAMFPNNAVYANGEHILSKQYTIQTDDDAQEILQNFLTEVNHAAVNRGVLADPVTGSVGVIDGDQLYEMLEKISPIRGKFYLSAYAKENITSIGPLRLNIKITQRN